MANAAPPVPGFDIIILAGQSNMAGRGTYNAGLDPQAASVYQYACTPSTSILSGQAGTSANYKTVLNTSYPLEMPEAVETGLIGPVPAFSNGYAAANPGRKVLLVPVAFGGTTLCTVTHRWASGTPGDDLYENAIARANEAVAAAIALAPASAVVGIGWLQGESEVSIAQATYAAAMDALIAGFRSRITGASNAWFSVLSMTPDYISVSASNMTAIDAAHRDTPNRNTKCVFVPGIKLQTLANPIHYNDVGQRYVGNNWAKSIAWLNGQMATALQTTITYADHGEGATAGATFTFSGKSFSTAAANRTIVVGVTARQSGTAIAPSSVTIGGVTATPVVTLQSPTTDGQFTGLYSASVPTGTTGTVVVNWPVSVTRCGVGIWAVYGIGASAPTTDTAAAQNGALAGLSVFIPPGGVAICYSGATGGGGWTWTSQAPSTTTITKRFDLAVQATYMHSGADAAPPAGGPHQFNGANSVSGVYSTVAAAWGPS
ncbi:sialate O-acetylesterase [Frankia sp. RB7]|nr:sialate O-acetylesterase [Frankia sp. RB7]